MPSVDRWTWKPLWSEELGSQAPRDLSVLGEQVDDLQIDRRQTGTLISAVTTLDERRSPGC